MRKQRPRGLNRLTQGHSVSDRARMQTQASKSSRSWDLGVNPGSVTHGCVILGRSLSFSGPVPHLNSGLLLMTSTGLSNFDGLTEFNLSFCWVVAHFVKFGF